MTKTLDIPPALIERARLLTFMRTDEEVILAALEAFVERNEPLDPERPRFQKDFVKYLGTSDGFFSPAELDEMRAAE